MCSLSSYENEKTAGMRCSRRFCRLNVLATNLYQPTGNLDSRNTQAVVQLLQYFSRKMGRTILFVTHNMELTTGCDRVIVVKDGKTGNREVEG